jgi:hypothetical protein
MLHLWNYLSQLSDHKQTTICVCPTLTLTLKNRLPPPKRFCKIVTALQADKMDYQSRAGSRFGGGAIASKDESAMDRREQLHRLALETIDISKIHMEAKTTWDHTNASSASHLTSTMAPTSPTHREKKSNKFSLQCGSGIHVRNIQGPDSRVPFSPWATGLYLKNVPVNKNFMNIARPGYRVNCLTIRSHPPHSHISHLNHRVLPLPVSVSEDWAAAGRQMGDESYECL